MPVRSGVLLLACVVLGCTPIPVSHYRTAEPLGKGSHQFAAGFQVPKDGDTGTDFDRSKGAPVDVDHAPILVIDNLDVEYRRGITARTELLAKVHLFGGKIGVRHTWLESGPFAASVGASAGLFTGTKVRSNSVGSYVDFPATVSWRRDEHLAVFGGVTATRITVTRWVDDERLLEPKYKRRARPLQLGGFAGFCFGKGVQFYPGVTFYLEPDEYPIRNLPQRSVFVYPWIGMSAEPATVRNWFRRPPPRPLPVEEPEEEEVEEEPEETDAAPDATPDPAPEETPEAPVP